MKCHIALCEEATIIVLNLCAWTQSDKSYKDIPHSDGFRIHFIPWFQWKAKKYIETSSYDDICCLIESRRTSSEHIPIESQWASDPRDMHHELFE